MSSFSEDWHKLCNRLSQMSYRIVFISAVLGILLFCRCGEAFLKPNETPNHEIMIVLGTLLDVPRQALAQAAVVPAPVSISAACPVQSKTRDGALPAGVSVFWRDALLQCPSLSCRC